jgi:hypothetical protein
MAGRIKKALSFTGDVLNAMGETNARVNDMTNEIMRRSYGVDADQARKVAQVLVHHAEVTWK